MDRNKTKKLYKFLMRKFKGNKIMQTITLVAFLLIGGYYTLLQNHDNLDVPTFGKNSNTGDLTYCQIDVGQGDSTLVQVNDKVVLIDAGTRESQEDIAKHLKSHNITTIDYLISTHSHADHIGGMKYIVDNFEIKNYLHGDNGHNTATYEKLMDSIDAEGCTVAKIDDDTHIALGDNTYIEVLDDGVYNGDNLNNYSPILYIKHGNTGIISSGDAEKEVEDRLLATEKNIPDVDLFKAGHHGSDTSNSKAFIEAIKPEIVLVSVGADNSYGHPHHNFKQTMKNLSINWLRTDKEGTIEFKSDGNTLERVS